MNKLAAVLFAVIVFLAVAAPAMAQDVDVPAAATAAAVGPAALNEGFSIYFGAAFGAGLIMIGAGWGFGRIGAHAVESMARQPEVAGNVQTAMLIAAALLEGATFFALIVCILTLVL